MNLKYKFTSFLLAMMMVLGLVLPTSVYADGPTPFNITIHKIKLAALPAQGDFAIQTSGEHIGKRLGKDKTTYYDGGKIENIQSYFGDQTAEPMVGVTFAYWEISKAAYEALSANASKLADLKTAAAVTDYGTANNGYLVNAAGKVVTNPTTAEGVVVNLGADLTKEEKYYLFIEENYGQALPDGSAATGSAAVPFLLAFPMGKPADGTPFASGELHVYPKNTVDKPTVDKKITGHTGNDPKEVTLGSEIPFEINTKIPLGTYYANMKWDDRMTAGLTFMPNSLTVKYKVGEDGNLETLTKSTNGTNNDYILTSDNQGFSVVLTEAGRNKVNPQNPQPARTKPVYVTLNYNAKVNVNAKVTIPDRNDVSFVYGNDPTVENTPIPNKPKEDPKKPGPNNGIIKAEKSFVMKNGGTDEPQNWTATLELLNANTRQKVGDDKVINSTTKTVQWENLDTNYEYIVVEKVRVPGFVPVYEKSTDEAGVTKIKNTENNNPPPVTPEPKPGEPPVSVRTFGKRFVKTNDQANATRLPGAEFVVSKTEADQTVKYLKVTMTDANAYTTALTAYETVVDAYNKAETKDDAVLNPVKEKHAALQAAYLANATALEWVDNKSEATKFASDAEGRLEVSGLASGEYALQEVRAPRGYAERQSPIAFTANATSLEDGDIEYYTTAVPAEAANQAPRKALRVVNKLISIPQTGGMGTVLFTVVGIALMLLALVAMKRNKAEQE